MQRLSVFAVPSQHSASADGRSSAQALRGGCTLSGDTATQQVQSTQDQTPKTEMAACVCRAPRSVFASSRCTAQISFSASPLLAPSSDPASGSDGSLAVTSCGNPSKAKVLKRGSLVTKSGTEYRIASIGKTGVVKLNNLHGGFAMFSHVSACK